MTDAELNDINNLFDCISPGFLNQFRTEINKTKLECQNLQIFNKTLY